MNEDGTPPAPISPMSIAIRICPGCQNEYKPQAFNHAYCSPRCRQVAYRKRKTHKAGAAPVDFQCVSRNVLTTSHNPSRETLKAFCETLAMPAWQDRTVIVTGEIPEDFPWPDCITRTIQNDRSTLLAFDGTKSDPTFDEMMKQIYGENYKENYANPK